MVIYFGFDNVIMPIYVLMEPILYSNPCVFLDVWTSFMALHIRQTGIKSHRYTCFYVKENRMTKMESSSSGVHCTRLQQ